MKAVSSMAPSPSLTLQPLPWAWGLIFGPQQTSSAASQRQCGAEAASPSAYALQGMAGGCSSSELWISLNHELKEWELPKNGSPEGFGTICCLLASFLELSLMRLLSSHLDARLLGCWVCLARNPAAAVSWTSSCTKSLIFVFSYYFWWMVVGMQIQLKSLLCEFMLDVAWAH